MSNYSKLVILLKGLPASGKTQFARKLVDSKTGKYKRISKDDMRAMFDNSKFSKGNENFILKLRDTIIIDSLRQGYTPIIDDTNLHPKHEERIKTLVSDLSKTWGKEIDIQIQSFTDVPVTVCIERDKKRERPVGKQVIYSMYRKYIQREVPLLEQDKSLPRAIVVDIDGTLALMGNKRSPYDTAKCIHDDLCVPINETIKVFTLAGYYILLLSGRSSEHRDITLEWLDIHRVCYNELIMRKEGDTRKDYLVKKELYEAHIKDKYNMICAIDDRPQVRRMWIEEGIYVLCAYQDPYFTEF